MTWAHWLYWYAATGAVVAGVRWSIARGLTVLGLPDVTHPIYALASAVLWPLELSLGIWRAANLPKGGQ